jgi:hypothetical protein
VGRNLASDLGGQGTSCLFSSQMQKHGKYTRNWNEVKRIIILTGYSNDWGAAGEKEEPTLAKTARIGPPVRIIGRTVPLRGRRKERLSCAETAQRMVRPRCLKKR